MWPGRSPPTNQGRVPGCARLLCSPHYPYHLPRPISARPAIVAAVADTIATAPSSYRLDSAPADWGQHPNGHPPHRQSPPPCRPLAKRGNLSVMHAISSLQIRWLTCKSLWASLANCMTAFLSTNCRPLWAFSAYLVQLQLVRLVLPICRGRMLLSGCPSRRWLVGIQAAPESTPRPTEVHRPATQLSETFLASILLSAAATSPHSVASSSSKMATLAPLLQHPMWDVSRESRHEVAPSHVRLHYERAKMLCQASGQ